MVTESYPVIAYSFFIVLIAGFVRGYSGFGASMIIVIGLSLVHQVMDIVPSVLMLEIIASAYLLPRVYKEVDWSSLKALLIGVVIGTPFGVYLLSRLPDQVMRSAIAVLVMLLIPLLWKGFTLKQSPGKKLTFFTGIFSGLINGSAAIGGPPVVLFYFSSPIGANISRASLIAFFLATDIIASGICLWNGLIDRNTLHMTALLLVPMIIGLTVGARSFFKTDLELFRKRVLGLLLIMAVTTLTRSIFF